MEQREQSIDKGADCFIGDGESQKYHFDNLKFEYSHMGIIRSKCNEAKSKDLRLKL